MWTPAGIIAILFCAACSLDASSRGPFGPADPETPVPKRSLPAHVPARHVLEFTADESPGHVKPKMAGAAMDAGVTRSPSPIMPLSVRDVASMRNAAEADPRVAALLGARWGFIDADATPPKSKVSFGCCQISSRFTRLTYFSYSHNVAVDVRMKDGGVLEASRSEGYLPPEGPQDVARGIELARADQRLAGNVRDMHGHGLLMQPDRGFFRNDPGYSHRVMWITFSQGVGGDPKYWAQVDLTDDRVLDAGAEPPR